MKAQLEVPTTRRYATLAAVCAASFTILLATSSMNVALPSLVGDLSANTRDLQWIVDGYNLAFASFVLAFGSLSDRYGRKGALLLTFYRQINSGDGGQHEISQIPLLGSRSLNICRMRSNEAFRCPVRGIVPAARTDKDSAKLLGRICCKR